jgi:pimeloyl-ACP methyl ester carboxylesterase
MSRLILLPGLDGTGRLFAPFIAALRTVAQCRVIALPEDAAASYESLAQRIRLALEAEDSFHVLAESFSGPIGIRLAASMPDRVRSLTLCATFAAPPWPALKHAAAVLAAGTRLAPPSFAARALFGRLPSQQALVAKEILGALPTEVLSSRLRCIANADEFEALRNLMCPVLYLRASRDWVVPPASMRAVRRVCTNLEVEAIDAPHGLLQAAPEAAAETVGRFISKIDSGRASLN